MLDAWRLRHAVFAVGCAVMTVLMVYAGGAADDAEVTRTGGTPLVPAVFSWPVCRACGGPMQFLAQVKLADLGVDEWRGVLPIFMCQNDPGMCEEWDAVAGGNQALVIPAGALVPATVPMCPATVPGEVSAVRCVIVSEDYDQARRAWPGREGRLGRDVLGQARRPAVVGAS